MHDFIDIRPSDLLLDEENPRNAEPNSGQLQAALTLAQEMGTKLSALAEDILNFGLNPSELPTVTRMKGDSGRYIVLEGNRRLVALKALENPDMFSSAISPKTLSQLRTMNKSYLLNPVDSVRCVLLSRKEAEHWIKLKHTGENKGAGVVSWNADQVSRYNSRSTGKKPGLYEQALRMLEDAGKLSASERKRLPVTSFKRMIQTPEVREKLGLTVIDGILLIGADKKQSIKLTKHIVDELISGNLKVSDIYTKAQRVAYAQKLPQSKKPSGKQNSSPSPSGTPPVPKPSNAPAPPPKPKKRDYLIPADCTLNIQGTRLREMSEELRVLSLESYPNAISVLLRVFMELSVDAYIEEYDPKLKPGNQNLANKVAAVLMDLEARQKLSKKQREAASACVQSKNFLAASINVMHAYIHNEELCPQQSDLRNAWNTLQPFMVAMHS